ncbi:MAG: hypothetical protein KDJ67_00920 [Nitratireductor sp.]|nr:hypothetical protein [Nitratireductor sp.]
MKFVPIAVAAFLFLAGSASAQMSENVKFAPGNFGTMLSGTVKGNDYFDYKLGAKAGQELFVELTVTNTDGNGIAYFNILPPGSTGEAIYNGSMEDTGSTTVQLPESGEYTIRVYLMGNDRDAGKTVSYNVDVSIQ